jgi:hypothetical protein
VPKPFAAAFLLALIGGAAPAVAASGQFDLLCKGTQQLKTGAPATVWTERFRFDLDAKRWCRGACRTASPIAGVTADEIMLTDSRASIGGPADAALSFSRTSGAVRESIEMGWSGGAATLAEGKCTRDGFSGLPGQRF